MTQPGADPPWITDWRRFPVFGALRVRPPISQASVPEGRLLQDAARGVRCAVEIGVAEAGSARYIREAMDPEGVLYLVDPYKPGRLGINMQLVIARRVMRGSRGPLEWVRARSDEVIHSWDKEIDFLHFDAETSFDALARDWHAWSPYVRAQGHVAFNGARVDEGGWVTPDLGPARVITEVIAPDPHWDVVDGADAAVAVRRSHSA